MPELPTCDCIGGYPPFDRLTFIYQAAAELSGDTSLPSANCVAGVPPFERFSYIYAAFRVLAGDDSLPSMECVEGEPFQDQVTRIYQSAFAYAGDAGLPAVACVRGTPIWQQWVKIYAALYSAAGAPAELTSPYCLSSNFDILSHVYCGLVFLTENGNPIVLSATITPDGLNMQIVFNQAVDGHDGFSATINGNPLGLAYSSGDGTTTLTLEIDTPVTDGDVVLLSYDQNLGNVVSAATGNILESFTDFPVTNPFTTSTFLRPGGTFTYHRPDGTSIYIRP